MSMGAGGHRRMPLEPVEQRLDAYGREECDAHRRQAGEHRPLRTTETEHHRHRGEWQSIATGDTTGRTSGAGQIAADAEPGGEDATGEIADGDKGDEDAAAAARSRGRCRR